MRAFTRAADNLMNTQTVRPPQVRDRMARRIAKQVSRIQPRGQYQITSDLSALFGRTPRQLAQWIARELELLGVEDIHYHEHRIVSKTSELINAVTFYRP